MSPYPIWKAIGRLIVETCRLIITVLEETEK